METQTIEVFVPENWLFHSITPAMVHSLFGGYMVEGWKPDITPLSNQQLFRQTDGGFLVDVTLQREL